MFVSVTAARTIAALAVSVGTSAFIFSVWAAILYHRALSLPANKSRHGLGVLAQLRQLIAWKDKFTDGTKEATRQLAQGDRPRRSWIFPLVIAAACFLAGGIAIPLLAGAKAELIYTNIVGAISAMGAVAALIKGQKPPPN